MDWSDNQFRESSHGALANLPAMLPFLKTPMTPNFGRSLLDVCN
jgi:hypothetical protein